MTLFLKGLSSLIGTITVAVAFLLPSVSYALEPDLCVTNAGNSAYNGTYTDRNSAINTYPSYTNGSKYLYVNVEQSHWIFRYDTAGSGSDYYRAVDASTPLGEYTANEQSAPNAIVALCDTGGGGSGTSTLATSTADTNALAYGLAWVLFFMSLIFTGFIWNKV